MGKTADIYFKEDPWRIIEEGFDKDHSRIAESVFSLANEYMGVRGYFEEGYSGERLQGSYFNGLYERKKVGEGTYKGVVNEMEFMVNSPDQLYMHLSAISPTGEVYELDLNKSEFSDFLRTLDMKSGLLKRSFVWHTKAGDISLIFERILSMDNVAYLGQRLTALSDSFEGQLVVTAGIDADTVHEGRYKYWKRTGINTDLESDSCSISLETRSTGQKLTESCKIFYSGGEAIKSVAEGNMLSAISYSFHMGPGSRIVVDKIVCCANDKLGEISRSSAGGRDSNGACYKDLYHGEAAYPAFDEIVNANSKWWADIWEKSDIEIEGDPLNQQGIRFCIFQLFQTYQGVVPGSNIGAKGLTGEAYNGNAFWDTETYCLPVYIFHDKRAAGNLLLFRYRTLEEAKKRARDLDLNGAFYPIATISGRECCNLWQHASLQLQASTAVAYGLYIYEKITGEKDFIYDHGCEMLIEICRMLADRGDYNADHSAYSFYGVMGPDEFQMMVDHDCYTNYMARFTFDYLLRLYDEMEESCPDKLKAVCDKTSFCGSELEDFRDRSDKMLILYDSDTRLYEQQAGFFDLPHIDVDQIPDEDFPLYAHWSYDRIYRNDMIKQPSVLMLMFMFASSFSAADLRANYDYYAPRCIHESSLSPSVHSILAESLGREQEAYDFFGFATRMDLDNYNRNTAEGIHTTSIAAAWMNIVYGFAGMRSDGDLISFAPSLPESWKSYSFRLVIGGQVLKVSVSGDGASFTLMGKGELTVKIYDEIYRITEDETVLPLKGVAA
ncbi:glycoside hydrolase family 65 protein [Butyrivibrio sp. MC2013]|uniref:glycoside hydrolase family 65 protein n=1 Tax=Butyrivibrio sp. MC2013 TaxID=1280686 RepID=UPI000425863B|nr:glycosyl hydrolase family 65 protein [Butyrivibrio sp. MC2013]